MTDAAPRSSGAPPEVPTGGVGVDVDLVIVAAGRSTRMGGPDKLQVEVAGRPLLGWTVAAFATVPEVGRIVVVTAADRVDAVDGAAWLTPTVIAVVPGGERRQDSVAAGVAALDAAGRAPDDRVLLVHDGARPVVDAPLVRAVIAATAEHGAAIPVLPIAETVKRIDGERVGETVDRESLGVAQTPQGIRYGVLRQAYAAFPPAGSTPFTDEAALLEACRIPVHVIPGDPSNIKVTRPADLQRVGAALATPRPMGTAGRVGIGQDSHPFGPGEPLALGGITIEGAPRLHGHSDGDVAIHAICDALLGAAGLGDLGRHFPAGPETPEGIESSRMLEAIAGRVGEAGWTVANVDLTITAARPRLSDRLDDMRTAIAATLAVDPAAVNVKASSGNHVGDEGAGRAISAIAVAMLAARS